MNCCYIVDLVEGRPTGSIRVSFGYMSLRTDADRLVDLVRQEREHQGMFQKNGLLFDYCLTRLSVLRI